MIRSWLFCSAFESDYGRWKWREWSWYVVYRAHLRIWR